MATNASGSKHKAKLISKTMDVGKFPVQLSKISSARNTEVFVNKTGLQRSTIRNCSSYVASVLQGAGMYAELLSAVHADWPP